MILSDEDMKVWRGENPKLKEDSPGEVDRSATLMKIGRVLYDAGATRRPIVDALEERDRALGYEKYSGNRDGGRKEYERICDKLAEEGRNPERRVTTVTAKTLTSGSREEEPLKMAEEAFRGPFREIVELVDPHTEGDPVAVLTGAVTAFGNVVGRGPYVQIGATKHRTNLFTANVGDTSKGRKGSAWNPVKEIMHAVDAIWAETRIVSGLSSGEGLISEVRDPVEVPDGEGGTKTIDPGAPDKRLLVVEGELSQALKMMKREGNTLSPVMRNGWDGETLRTLVKHAPLRATDPHISVLGHITREELVRHLTETEMANGLANRFLWVLVKRSKLLSRGGNWHTVDVAPIAQKLRLALQLASKEHRMTWSDAGGKLWDEMYEMLTEERAGMFGAVTARAEAQTLRLSMLYALADRAQVIKRTHVESALAVWEYSEESARRIFGDLIGDPDADKVLATMKAAGGSMTRTEVRDLFGRNKGREQLDRIREALVRTQRILVSLTTEEGSKKPVERWYVA